MAATLKMAAIFEKYQLGPISSFNRHKKLYLGIKLWNIHSEGFTVYKLFDVLWRTSSWNTDTQFDLWFTHACKSVLRATVLLKKN